MFTGKILEQSVKQIFEGSCFKSMLLGKPQTQS